MAELSCEERKRAVAALHETFKRPAGEHDDEGLHRIAGGLAVYVSRRDRESSPLLIVRDGAYGLEEKK